MKKNNQKQCILLATGGTGGHIFPALALKDALEKNGYKVKVTADARFAKFHPFDDDNIFIPSANFVNRSPLKILTSLFTLFKGFVKALLLIHKEQPKIVIGFGGYVSYPTMLAAIILGKEIILHEANTVIGKVNRILLWRAKYLTTGFPVTKGVKAKYQDKVVYTGNPVRPEILASSLKKKTHSDDKLSILIIGGSQGAKIFSKIIPEVIVNLPQAIKSKLHIYQQVKEEDIDLIKAKYAKENIACEIKSFFNDMNKQLAQADLMISRAGASTIAELIAFKLPAIFIPYPSATDNHQYYNAEEIVNAGGGWVVKEDANSPAQLLQIIKLIDKDPAILTKYSSALKSLQQDASANIVKLIEG